MNTGVYRFLGDRFVVSGDSVAKPTGAIDGCLLTSLESKRNYILSGNNWLEQNPVAIRTFFQVPTGGWPSQTIIGLSGNTIITGNNELNVYINGIYQQQDTTPTSRDFDWSFSGSSNTGIRVNYSLPSGCIVNFVGFR